MLQKIIEKLEEEQEANILRIDIAQWLNNYSIYGSD
jgi:hypothetical protein